MPIFGSGASKSSKDKKAPTRSTRSKKTSVKGKKSKPVKRVRRRNETYNLYIHRVLKLVSPDNGISKRAMLVTNSFVNDMYTRLAQEAVRLMKAAGRSTLTVGDVESAVQIIFPEELATHATSGGGKAVRLFAQD